MGTAGIDLAIVAAYLATVTAIGLAMRRRAARGIESYYLGDRRLPWPLLALSNAAGMFDVAGTMWLVALCFVYGLKSIWIPWLWPVFNQVFLMAYLSVWLRRSNAVSGADWIRTRFGGGRGGTLSHLAVIAFAVVSVLGFLGYALVGIGKFVAILIPWDRVAAYLPFALPPEQALVVYGLAIAAVATFYVMLGGLHGVVWADVVQYVLLAIAALVIGCIAMARVEPSALAAAVPAGWTDPFFGWRLELDWPDRVRGIDAKIASDGYTLFAAFFMMMLFKGVLVSAAGPAPNYDMQRVFATRSPRESALMSGAVSVILMPLRYFMVAGLAVLAIVYFEDLAAAGLTGADFEVAMASALVQFVPAGLLGLIVTALIAAFMSSFAATVNAAAVYLVHDFYGKYVNPGAGSRRLVHASYGVSLLIVVLGTWVAFAVDSINSILQWLVSGLWGGYTAANVLKWYWWRLNGHGYFWGMVSGIAGALVLPLAVAAAAPSLDVDLLPLYLFPLLLAVSGLVAVIVSLRTPIEDMDSLKDFYVTVRPWGWWGPVRELLRQERREVDANGDFRRDAFNVTLGTLAQTLLVALPIYVVIRDAGAVIVCVTGLVVAGAILKKTWYERLPPA
jgi:solute:Na+ symporter, SSS family